MRHSSGRSSIRHLERCEMNSSANTRERVSLLSFRVVVSSEATAMYVRVLPVDRVETNATSGFDSLLLLLWLDFMMMTLMVTRDLCQLRLFHLCFKKSLFVCFSFCIYYIYISIDRCKSRAARLVEHHILCVEAWIRFPARAFDGQDSLSLVRKYR